jgi:hypothetical protein
LTEWFARLAAVVRPRWRGGGGLWLGLEKAGDGRGPGWLFPVALAGWLGRLIFLRVVGRAMITVWERKCLVFKHFRSQTVIMNLAVTQPHQS